MSIGWVVVCFFTMFVALSMAEIVSAIPTSGGPYFWAAILAPPKYAPFLAWVTGWFNFVGQFAVTTGISFGLAQLISVTATIKNDYTPTPGKTLAIYIGVLISHGVLNSFGVHLLRYLNNTSIVLHSLGVGALAIAILAKAPTHQTAKQVFATFNDGTGLNGAVGWSVRASPAYVAVIGILQAQFTITGFDASAHLSEETRDASRSAPWGIIMSIGVSFAFGWFWMLSLLFSMQGLEQTLASKYSFPVVQILVDVFGENGAVVAMCLIMICVWHCGLFSLTSNSRMMFAFSRDRALPGWFDHVDPKHQAPIRTIWLAAFLAFVLALPSLGSAVAYSAATSIATIALYISYVLPIAIMLVFPGHFEKGPWHLGKFSKPIGFVAVCWV
jgi:amino acid transporter